jgi:hypothetical protein
MGARQRRALRRQPSQRHDIRSVEAEAEGGDAHRISAAKSLFHRAIIAGTLADTAVAGQEPSRAIEAAEALLTRLGSRATSADAL